MSPGKKNDAGKVRADLTKPLAEREVWAVKTFGAIAYGDDNWKNVEPFVSRYMGALKRHINAFERGERFDPESGLHTLAHAQACIDFLLSDELGEGRERAPTMQHEEFEVRFEKAKAAALVKRDVRGKTLAPPAPVVDRRRR